MGSLDYNFNAASAVNESARNEMSNGWGPESETILPVQFFGKRNNSGRTEPVMRLMLAVLEDAVRCFERDLRARSVSRRRRFLEAEDWLFRQSESAGLFSFESVCEVIDIDPIGIRRALWLARNRLVHQSSGKVALRSTTPSNTKANLGIARQVEALKKTTLGSSTRN